MAVTRANFPAMKYAVEQLKEAVDQADAIFKRAETTLDSTRAAWSSPQAAPKFVLAMQEWNDDHQQLTAMALQLSQTVERVYQDLLNKEHNL
jgi:uncharacterized protein YukE